MSLHPWDFSGRRAAVTGGGGGIGLATTRLLLERGAQVLACDVDWGRLDEARTAGAETAAADLELADGRRKFAAAAGPCDYLVLAHGIVRPKPMAETSEEDWDAIIGVNAKAVYFLCQVFGTLLRDGGAIVALSSVSARSAASQEQSVYCASKAAVGLDRTELRVRVRIPRYPRQRRTSWDR